MNGKEIETKRRLGAFLCDKVKRMFLNGECDHITSDDFDLIERIARRKKYYSPSEAIKYLNVSHNRFYDLRKAGLIGSPILVPALNKYVYTLDTLDKAIETMKGMTDKEIKIKILSAKAKK